MTQSGSTMNTYARLPVEFCRGEGSWLYDSQGTAYLDALSGIAVCGLGHAHPAVTEALCKQAGQLVHTSNLYRIPAQQALADKLIDISGMDNCFFSNSGAEANEAAIKIARLHGHKKGLENPAIIVFEQAFHGRTLATLSATGNRKIQAGFEPLVKGFVRAPYDDIAAVETIARNNPDITAILVEPIQGEGGVIMPSTDFLSQLRQICEQHGWLLMLDEVQTGNGRTGRYFAYQHYDWLPDVVTTAKGLANGVPIGACLAHGEAAGVFAPGNHGSTFGGNPLACAAALATINTLHEQNCIAHAASMGAHIMQAFRERLADNKKVREVRGQGLMIGIALDRDCTTLVNRALEEKLLINVTAGNVIRLLPALIINREEADKMIDIVCRLISELD